MTTSGTLTLFETLQDDLGYAFQDLALLQQALTHKSAPDADKGHYERLEFLGDRILGQAISLALFQHFEDDHQGDLTKRYHALVQQGTLADIAIKLNLADIIITDNTKQAAQQASVLSDVVEALIAALYLDGGQAASDAFIYRYLDITKTSADDGDANPKSDLQEWVMAQKWPMPHYHLIKTSGPDHAPEFLIEVSVADKGKTTATGTSKKIAEQQAARALLATFKQKVTR